MFDQLGKRPAESIDPSVCHFDDCALLWVRNYDNDGHLESLGLVGNVTLIVVRAQLDAVEHSQASYHFN